MELTVGYIELIIGPMFSGKTNKLITRYNQIKETILKQKHPELQLLLTINYNLDIRYGTNKIVSHDGNAIDCLAINKLSELQIEPNFTQLRQSKYIFINEAQFFGDLKEWVIEQVDKYNKHIILCGLDSDFKRERFGDLLDIIPHANSIVKLNGTCSKCNNPSIYTHRVTQEIEQEIIGTTNYIPVCRTCYLSITY
jgi:thymidine kinase